MRRLRRLGSVSIAVYAAIVLAAVFICGLGLDLAGRDPASAVDGSGGGKKNSRLVDRFGPDSSYFYWQRTNLPHAQDRAPGLSPFGDAFRTIEIPRDRHGLVLTPLGFLDLKNPRALDALPPGLKRSATHVRAGRGGPAPTIWRACAAAWRPWRGRAPSATTRTAGRCFAWRRPPRRLRRSRRSTRSGRSRRSPRRCWRTPRPAAWS